MDFFNLPAEIRLQIYEELLVLSEPIIFPPYRPFFPYQRYGLCPSLLRTNKGVHREASPMLYSRNCFEFSEPTPSRAQRLHANYASAFTSFLSRTGDQNASFIRHLHIGFPAFEKPGLIGPALRLKEDSIKALELIRDKCTSIARLDTSLQDEDDLWLFESYKADSVVEAAFTSLDARFKEISSLKEVNVHIISYDGPSNGYDGPSNGPSNGLMKKMRDCGWTVNATLENLGDPDEDYGEMFDEDFEEEWDPDVIEEQYFRCLYG